MLRKVAVSQLRVGMFFERAEGQWMDHTLWRSRFLIDGGGRLSVIVASGVQECWIDTDKGLDIDTAHVVEGPLPSPEVIVAPDLPVSALDPTAPAMPAAELPGADLICEHALAVIEHLFEEIRLGRVPDVDVSRPIAEEIRRSVTDHCGELTALARLKGHGDYTYMHSISVAAHMVALSRELGLDHAHCRDAALAGFLHDIGKARIPLDILHKPGKLTEAEFDIVREHPAHGHQLLVASGLDNRAVLDVCLYHHEKIDGSGYPEGLVGDAIPLMARMGAVCDVFDAVTSRRSYKEAWDPAYALNQMATWRGHFDRVVLAAFIKTVGVFPPGSLVRLASGRLAVVVQARQHQLRAPLVRVFFSVASKAPLPLELLDLSLPDAVDRISAPEPREHWNFPNLDELSAL